MRKIFGTFSLSLLVAVGVTATDFVDQSQREIREEFLSLSARVDVRTPAYSRSRADDAFIVFGPGPYVLSIAVSNSTDQPVEFRSSRRDWSENLSINLKRHGEINGRATSRTAHIRRASKQPTPGITRLDARRSVSDRFILETESALDPGEYIITVEIDEDNLDQTARQSRNVLRREIKLRVVEPQSTSERMDQLLQMSSQAMRSEQYAIVRNVSAQVLALNTDSIAARIDIGTSYLAQMNCAAAKPVMLEAIGLLEAGRDPDLMLSESAREELRWATRARLLKDCP